MGSLIMGQYETNAGSCQLAI